MDFVSKTQKPVGCFPKHPLRQGDRVGSGSKISGDDTGFALAAAPPSGAGLLALHAPRPSPRGCSQRKDLLPHGVHDTPIAITSGTGTYDGACGTPS
jgi:hypothetical protein